MEQLLRPVKRQPGDLAPQSRSEFGAPKDNSSGQVAMSTELVSALRKHQKEEQLRRGLTGLPTKGLIFCKEDGSPLYDRTVGRVFKECLDALDIASRVPRSATVACMT